MINSNPKLLRQTSGDNRGWFRRLVMALWCYLFHKRHLHTQKYTDRYRLYERTECWKCKVPRSGLRVAKNQNPYE